MTTTNECGSTTIEQEIVVSTVGVEDIEGFIFNIFPNPATADITIHINTVQAELSVFDLQGKLVKKKTVINGEVISMVNVPNGTYLVQLTDGEKSGYSKLVLMK